MESRQPIAISGTPVPSLLLAVFNSIIEVFLTCFAGYILARHGVLDKKTQKQMNRLNVSLFTPALLFSKVAFFLTPEKLKELWVIPIWFIIVTATSMVVGRILGSLFRLRPSQRSFVVAAAMFMNSNALPIALMQSLVLSVPDLMWGSDDNQDAMLGRALTYLTMYSTLGMVLRYSYGVQLLSRADTIHHPDEIANERSPLLQENAIISSPPSTIISSPPSTTTLAGNESSLQPPRRNTAFYNSFPNSPNDSRTYLSRYDSIYTSDTDNEADVDTPHVPNHGCLYHSWRRIVRAAAIVNSFMTVPLWAALMSLLVACIEPLKHALLNHLQPLNNAISTAGKCSVPVTLVVLGAYFHVQDDTTESSSPTFIQSIRQLFHCKDPLMPPPRKIQTAPGETKTVILAVASRMIVTPILLCPAMALATRYDWHAVFQDPTFVVINVILVCSPPALTLAQITQAASGDAFERLISRTIFWSYCVFTPPVMIASVLVALVLANPQF